MTTRPDIGDSLPDIALETPEGGSVRPTDFSGRPLVLFFYPKDDTPGCTTENRDFSALKATFDAAGVALLGISKDPPARHRKFTDKHALSAPLASDMETGGLADALGIWGEKSMYGRTYMGMERTTYLVDVQGKIARVWRKVKVKGHAAEVLEASPGAVTDVAAAIRAALLTADPRAKVMAARRVARDWRLGRLAPSFAARMPDRPAWPAALEVIAPSRMPRRGRGGSERTRIAMWHALAHIEFVAIDLALDMAGRFGAAMGAGFVSDFLAVAADECDAFRAARAQIARARRALRRAAGARWVVGGRTRNLRRCRGAPRRGADGARGTRARCHAGRDRSRPPARRRAWCSDPGTNP